MKVFLALIFISSHCFAIRGETSSNYPQDLDRSVVSILKKREAKFVHTCSGTIISSRLILTAAHCFDDKIFHLKVDYKGEEYVVSKVKIHSKYNRIDLVDPDWGYVYDIKIENDIALIEVKKDLPKEKIELVTKTYSLSRALPLLISGYGQTANIFGMGTGEGVYRVSLETYADEISSERIIIEDGRTGACQGDSGGPLWTRIEDRWVQLAITSQGDCNVQTQFERISLEKVFESSYREIVVD